MNFTYFSYFSAAVNYWLTLFVGQCWTKNENIAVGKGCILTSNSSVRQQPIHFQHVGNS